MSEASRREVRAELEPSLARLWRYALVLSKARDVADDLVQATYLRATSGPINFVPRNAGSHPTTVRNPSLDLRSMKYDRDEFAKAAASLAPSEAIDRPTARVRRCWHRGIASGSAFVWGPAISTATAARWSRSSRTSSAPMRVSTTAAKLLPIFWSPPTASSPRCDEQLMPAVEPVYAGYVAWRALVDMAELSGEARDLLRNEFAFCLPDRRTGAGLSGRRRSGLGGPL